MTEAEAYELQQNSKFAIIERLKDYFKATNRLDYADSYVADELTEMINEVTSTKFEVKLVL